MIHPLGGGFFESWVKFNFFHHHRLAFNQGTNMSSMFSLTAMGRQEKTKIERQILFSHHDSGDNYPKIFLDELKRGENSRPDVSRLLALFLPTQDGVLFLNNSQNRSLGFVRVHILYSANRKLSPEVMGNHCKSPEDETIETKNAPWRFEPH